MARILLIEGDLPTGRTIQAQLLAGDHDVVWVTDGQEGLTLAMVKPFPAHELTARIAMLLRQATENRANVIERAGENHMNPTPTLSSLMFGNPTSAVIAAIPSKR